MPSAANASATTLLASGSTGPRMRSATSSTVTCTPKRENACASSAPIGPPPTTTSEPGASSARSTSRFVQYGVSASPSIGGAAGSVPVFSTTPFAAVYDRAVHLDGARPGQPGLAVHAPRRRRP